MEGLFNIPRLIFVFPKPFLWLQVTPPPTPRLEDEAFKGIRQER